MSRRAIGLMLGFVVAASCSKENNINTGGDEFVSVTQDIGPSGGDIVHPRGAALKVSARALVSIETITVRNVAQSEVDPLPDGLEPSSEFFSFEPHGQTFAVPVDISLACRGGGDAIYTSVDGTRWQAIAGLVREGTFTHVYQDHFSYFVCADDPGVEVCNTAGDEDGDDLSDCADDDCAGVPECLAPDEEDCATAADDDDDGDVNCRDSDCVDDPLCVSGAGGAGGDGGAGATGGAAGESGGAGATGGADGGNGGDGATSGAAGEDSSGGGASATGGTIGEGGALVPTAICGDMSVDLGEVCDDGNTDRGDGCSADCRTVEAGFACPETGGMCTNETGGAGGGDAGGNGGVSNAGGGVGGGGGTLPPNGGTDPDSGGSGPLPGTDGWASRYWDCCKPSCGWTANASDPVDSCDINDDNIGVDDGAQDVCSGGTAFTCHSFAPWSLSDDLSYGFARFNGAQCGACFQIQFSGSSSRGTAAPGIEGKQMVVQVIGIGAIEANQFEILIPGGGVGAMTGCTTQWGTGEVGDLFGGFRQTCGPDGDCIRSMCQNAFGDFPELMAGCNWYIDWLLMADNPDLSYAPIDCPAEIRAVSGG